MLLIYNVCFNELFHSQDLNSNSPYELMDNYYDLSSENLLLDDNPLIYISLYPHHLST